jgi:hypothetical protein
LGSNQYWFDGHPAWRLSPSRNIVVAAHTNGLPKPGVAKRRLALLGNIPVLALSGDVQEFARRLLAAGAVPAKAALDGLHIGVAALNRMDYLLTWNCAHIANAAVRGKIEETCRSAGLRAPIICTPEELMEP